MQPGAVETQAASASDIAGAAAKTAVANTLYQNSKYSDAEALYREAFKLNPTSESAYNLGRALYRQTKYSAAERYFRHGYRLDPTNSSIALRLGVALDCQGKTADAEGAFRDAVRLNPSNATNLWWLGRALDNQGKFLESEAVYRTAVRLDPSNALYVNLLGNTLYSQRKFTEAERFYRDAVRLDPSQANYVYALGIALHAQKLYANATQHLRKAVDADPASALFAYALADNLFAQELYSSAVMFYRKAVGLAPDNAAYQKDLNLCLGMLPPNSSKRLKNVPRTKPMSVGLTDAAKQVRATVEAAIAKAERSKPAQSELRDILDRYESRLGSFWPGAPELEKTCKQLRGFLVRRRDAADLQQCRAEIVHLLKQIHNKVSDDCGMPRLYSAAAITNTLDAQPEAAGGAQSSEQPNSPNSNVLSTKPGVGDQQAHELALVRGELEKLKRERDDLRKEVEQLRLLKDKVAQLEKLKTQIDQLGPLRSKIASLEPLESEVQRLRSQVSELPELKKYKAEADELRPLKAKVETLSQLQSEVQHLRPFKAEVESLKPLKSEVRSLRPLKAEVERLRPLAAELEGMRRLQEDVQRLGYEVRMAEHRTIEFILSESAFETQLQPARFPGELQDFARQLLDTLTNLRSAPQNERKEWAAGNVNLLDRWVYASVPSSARTGAAEFDPDDALKPGLIAQAQHAVHRLLFDAGLRTIEPSAGEPYDTTLHETDEQLFVWVTDPAQDGLVDSVLRIGYCIDDRPPLRRALVRRTVLLAPKSENQSSDAGRLALDLLMSRNPASSTAIADAMTNSHAAGSDA